MCHHPCPQTVVGVVAKVQVRRLLGRGHYPSSRQACSRRLPSRPKAQVHRSHGGSPPSRLCSSSSSTVNATSVWWPQPRVTSNQALVELAAEGHLCGQRSRSAGRTAACPHPGSGRAWTRRPRHMRAARLWPEVTFVANGPGLQVARQHAPIQPSSRIMLVLVGLVVKGQCSRQTLSMSSRASA